MPHDYAYFAHDADIGVAGRGPTLEAAFAAAAHAMFSIQTDPGAVRPRERIEFEFAESDIELALMIWLNRLLGETRVRGLALADFGIARAGDSWSGWALGEPWRAEHSRGTEVKGATLTMLSVRCTGGTWEARCVVDV
ncbi:MAG: archease [Betaproteobacteria bacterium]|nr:archease [Betaproteobacteria bacterium]